MGQRIEYLLTDVLALADVERDLIRDALGDLLAHLIQPVWILSWQVWRKALSLRREWVLRPSCARRASLPHPP